MTFWPVISRCTPPGCTPSAWAISMKLHLGQDAVEGPGLVAVGGLQRVAVHRVDGPDHVAAGGLGRRHQPRQAARRSCRRRSGRYSVRRPGSLVGFEARRSGAAARRARPSGRPSARSGCCTPRANSTWAPSSWRVRSPIHSRWAEVSYQSPVVESTRVIASSKPSSRASWLVKNSTRCSVRIGLRGDADGGHEVQGLGDLVGQLAVARRVAGCRRRSPASSGGCCTGRHSRRRRRRAAGSASPPTGRRPRAAAADRACARPREAHAVDVVAAVGRAGDSRRGSRCGSERGLANWPAMRPTFTTGLPPAKVSTTAICRIRRKVSRMLSARNSLKLSAQSPPCSRKASPLATWPSSVFSRRASPANTSGGSSAQCAPRPRPARPGPDRPAAAAPRGRANSTGSSARSSTACSTGGASGERAQVQGGQRRFKLGRRHPRGVRDAHGVLSLRRGPLRGRGRPARPRRLPLRPVPQDLWPLLGLHRPAGVLR